MTKQRQLWLKIATIVGLILVLQIPLLWVDSAMGERQYYQQQAAQDIAQSWSYEQVVTGPFLVVPYKTQYQEEVWDKNLEAYVTRTRTQNNKKILVPERNIIDSDLTVERRFRGIYSAPVYNSSIEVKGSLDLTPIETIKKQAGFIKLGQPSLVTFVSDLRGVSEIPTLNYNKKSKYFTEGTPLSSSQHGLHVDLELDDTKTMEYEYSIKLKGSNALSFYPVGKNNSVTLESTWPHPKFNGRFLPDTRDIRDDGFSATWTLNSLSSNLNEIVGKCERNNCDELLNTHFGVEFLEPISAYSLADRASKYALLFLLLTFAAFFLFEIFKSLLIHPLQYLMVGLSLSLFYLLLVAFSEHMNFVIAYWISALACISLIGFYSSYVLCGMARAMTLSGALLLIYTLMFFILQSEDYAFVMGAILLFAILTTVMVITRKFNWYSLGEVLPKKK